MLLPCSCCDEKYIEDLFMEETVEGCFDALWNIIDRRYCFLGYAEETFGLDWNAVYHKYRSRLDNEKSTNFDLF